MTLRRTVGLLLHLSLCRLRIWSTPNRAVTIVRLCLDILDPGASICVRKVFYWIYGQPLFISNNGLKHLHTIGMFGNVLTLSGNLTKREICIIDETLLVMIDETLFVLIHDRIVL